LPLKQSPGCTNCICPCEEENTKRNRCSEIILDQENAGVEEILVAARRIMIDKKRAYCQESKEDKKVKLEEARRQENQSLLKQILYGRVQNVCP
jgi:hypothetical protein